MTAGWRTCARHSPFYYQQLNCHKFDFTDDGQSRRSPIRRVASRTCARFTTRALSCRQVFALSPHLQAVMKVPNREGRLAYLRKAFTSDWEGAAPTRAGSATARSAYTKAHNIACDRSMIRTDFQQPAAVGVE